jgi:hypothetical protein
MIVFDCHLIDDSGSVREGKANIGPGLARAAAETVGDGGQDRINLTCSRIDLRILAGGLSLIKLDRPKQP